MTLIAQVNELELRWAGEAREVRAAQALRYRVFYEELGAVPDPATRRERLDRDAFDDVARHLIVVDRSRSCGARLEVVGCYRLLRESTARRHGGLYTSAEFDLGGLTRERGELLELGRSCVDARHRGGAVMQLLWRGIALYQARHRFGMLIGCASLPGRDIARVAREVRYLHERHLAPLGMRPCARSSRRVAHEPFAAGAYDPSVAFRRLPPLVKGYLRAGAMVGEGAVLDEQFNTIDLCIVLPTERIEARYRRKYAVTGAPEPAFA